MNASFRSEGKNSSPASSGTTTEEKEINDP
jgi:hypothetical protein